MTLGLWLRTDTKPCQQTSAVPGIFSAATTSRATCWPWVGLRVVQLGGAKVGEQGLGPPGLSKDSLSCCVPGPSVPCGLCSRRSAPALVPESLLLCLSSDPLVSSVTHPICRYLSAFLESQVLMYPCLSKSAWICGIRLGAAGAPRGRAGPGTGNQANSSCSLRENSISPPELSPLGQWPVFGVQGDSCR